MGQGFVGELDYLKNTFLRKNSISTNDLGTLNYSSMFFCNIMFGQVVPSNTLLRAGKVRNHQQTFATDIRILSANESLNSCCEAVDVALGTPKCVS